MTKIFQYPGRNTPPVQPVAGPWLKRNTYYLAVSSDNADDNKSGASHRLDEDKYYVVRNNHSIVKFNRDGTKYGSNVALTTPTPFDDTESITYLGTSHPSGKKWAIANEGDTTPAAVAITVFDLNQDDSAVSNAVSYACPNINTVTGNYGAEGIAWDVRRGVFYIATQACTTGEGGVWQVHIDWGTSVVTEKLLFRWFDTIVAQGHSASGDFISELYYNPENLGVSNFFVLHNASPLGTGATKILEISLTGTVVATRALPAGQYEGLTFSTDDAKDMFICTEETGTDIYVFKRNLNTWQQPISQPFSIDHETARREFFDSYSPPFVPAGGSVALDGSIAASSIVAANLALALPLAGTIAAASTVAGNLGLAIQLSGSIAATSGVSGNLQVALALSGSVAATSTVAGNAAVALALAGSSAATSAVSGFAKCDWALSGSIAATSTVSGELSVDGDVALAGSLAAVSSVAGNLALTLPVSGSVAAASTVAGNLGLAIPLSGSIVAASGVSGALQGALALSGNVAAVSSVSGLAKCAWALSGSVSAASTVSGELTIQGQVQLSGSIAATSGVSGHLALAIPLSGAVAAASSVSGNLARAISLGGAVSAASSASGSIVLTLGLYGPISAQGVVAGAIAVAWSLSGAVNAASACSGNLTVEGLYVFVPGVIDVWKVPRRERSWVVPISNRSWKAGG